MLTTAEAGSGTAQGTRPCATRRRPGVVLRSVDSSAVSAPMSYFMYDARQVSCQELSASSRRVYICGVQKIIDFPSHVDRAWHVT